MEVPGLGVSNSISVRFRSLECVGFSLTSSKTHENCTHVVYFLLGRLFRHSAELSTPWIRFLWCDLQFFHKFCVVASIHTEFVLALFMILQWVYYHSFSTNIVTNYIYAFSRRSDIPWALFVCCSMLMTLGVFVISVLCMVVRC